MTDPKILEISENGRVVLIQDGSIYSFQDGNRRPYKTPRGKPITTNSKELANALFKSFIPEKDLPFPAQELISWQSSYVDFVSNMTPDQMSFLLMNDFLMNEDWSVPYLGHVDFEPQFETWQDRAEQIYNWIQKCTLMQANAASCIAHSYESLNLAFRLAAIVENFSGTEREYHLKGHANRLDCPGAFCGDALGSFKLFSLYYGIDAKKNKPILALI